MSLYISRLDHSRWNERGYDRMMFLSQLQSTISDQACVPHLPTTTFYLVFNQDWASGHFPMPGHLRRTVCQLTFRTHLTSQLSRNFKRLTYSYLTVHSKWTMYFAVGNFCIWRITNLFCNVMQCNLLNKCIVTIFTSVNNVERREIMKEREREQN